MRSSVPVAEAKAVPEATREFAPDFWKWSDDRGGFFSSDEKFPARI
jgi:hypothetical protein